MPEKKVGVIFDIDGTLLPETSMDRQFIRFLLEKRKLTARGVLAVFSFALKNITKGFDRIFKFNKYYLKGLNREEVEQWGRECFVEKVKPLVPQSSLDLINTHADQGHKIFFLSGALYFMVTNFAQDFGRGDFQWLGTKLKDQNGILTGEIDGFFPFGEGKVRLVKQIAKENNLNLAESYGYGDHPTDQLFLDLLGHGKLV